MIILSKEYAQIEFMVCEKTGITLTNMCPWHVLRLLLCLLDAVMDAAMIGSAL